MITDVTLLDAHQQMMYDVCLSQRDVLLFYGNWLVVDMPHEPQAPKYTFYKVPFAFVTITRSSHMFVGVCMFFTAMRSLTTNVLIDFKYTNEKKRKIFILSDLYVCVCECRRPDDDRGCLAVPLWWDLQCEGGHREFDDDDESLMPNEAQDAHRDARSGDVVLFIFCVHQI